ncbi:hypothetical protein [Pseudobdellovibrio exovorus]|nr:hypothetical protein [Pseudobdellovibrio exovorus]
MLILTILFVILQKKTALSNKVSDSEEPLLADTMIPLGYALLPLQLENIDSLASLIGAFGLIDLYGQQEDKVELLASRIKILQAPLNPHQYAVLVPQPLSRNIMLHGGPYWGTVLNRSENTSWPKSSKKVLGTEALSQETPREHLEIPPKNSSKKTNRKVKSKSFSTTPRKYLTSTPVEIEYHSGSPNRAH